VYFRSVTLTNLYLSFYQQDKERSIFETLFMLIKDKNLIASFQDTESSKDVDYFREMNYLVSKVQSPQQERNQEKRDACKSQTNT